MAEKKGGLLSGIKGLFGKKKKVELATPPKPPAELTPEEKAAMIAKQIADMKKRQAAEAPTDSPKGTYSDAGRKAGAAVRARNKKLKEAAGN